MPFHKPFCLSFPSTEGCTVTGAPHCSLQAGILLTLLPHIQSSSNCGAAEQRESPAQSFLHKPHPTLLNPRMPSPLLLSKYHQLPGKLPGLLPRLHPTLHPSPPRPSACPSHLEFTEPPHPKGCLVLCLKTSDVLSWRWDLWYANFRGPPIQILIEPGMTEALGL